MSRRATFALVASLVSAAVTAQTGLDFPRGIGVDQRLGAETASAATADFVQLLVPRRSVETTPGSYTFDALDAHIAALDDTPVLLTLLGMPESIEDESGWERYVLAVASRYRGQVAGYSLGRSDNAAERDAETYGYLLKLAAVQIKTVDADVILLAGDAVARDTVWFDSLYALDIASYFDGIAVTDEDDLASVVVTIANHHPSIVVLVSSVALSDTPRAAVRRALIESLTNLEAGAAATSFSGNDDAMTALSASAARLAELFEGDVVALDGGEAALDIRPASGRNDVRHRLFFNATSGTTLLVYWSENAGPEDTIEVRLKSFVPSPPTLHDPASDAGSSIDEFSYDAASSIASARVPLVNQPLVLAFPAPTSGATITASVGPSVSEIIARHQRVQTRQDNLLDSYHASLRDEIHFRPTTIDSFDVLMERRFYWDRDGSEWEELSFSLNGARWGSDRPAFPLLQPEKVLSLPLDLRFDRDYAYELEGRGALGNRDCYIVRFEPLSGSRSLYAGRVWIDAETFVKLKVETVQTELAAPVVSNAEVFHYEQQGELDGTAIFLLTRLSSKQLVLIAGRNLLVEKDSTFYDFHVNSPGFREARQKARDSDNLMLRDTDEGLRHFVKRGGERHVSDELTRDAKALAMGVTFDPSFDFPLPIVGLNYLDFDFLDRNAQFALLFGGIFALGNIQKSNLWGGSFDVSFDFFGIAIQSNDVIFDQDGQVDEADLRTIPASLGLNLGWQFTSFQKATARYDMRYDWYGRSDTTADEFETPTSTLSNGFTLGYEYRRNGYSLLTSGSYAKRANWMPWGDTSQFDPDTRDYWKYRAVFGKDFFIKTFHKIHVDAGYFGGERLDRFTSYQFGLFDETRVRGVPSTAVRFKELLLARASYSFNVFDQFRFELFYDRAWGDDPDAGLDRVGFSGLGVGLNVRGPWDTIVRVDVGKSFLPVALRGAGTVVTQFLVLKPL